MFMNNREHSGQHQRAAADAGLRLFVLAVSLGLLLATPAFGQAEYSDAYVYDSTEQYYDSSADALYAADDPAPFDLIGVGVTEVPYNSSAYSTSTTTTLYGPGGNSISQSSSGYFYARAEAFSLKLDSATAQEGDYDVSSEHWYYQQSCVDPRMECHQVRTAPEAPRALFERASFNPGAALGAAARRFYYVSYTFYRFSFRKMYTAYKFSRMGSPCGGDKPYAWFLWCGQNIPNCRLPVWVCTKFANYWLRGDVYRLYWYWGVTCHVRLYYSEWEPRCS